MELRAGMNLFISSFKKFPKAAAAAFLVIMLLEGSAWFVLSVIKQNCAERDLIRMDSDFLCRNLKKYKTDVYERSEKYRPISYNSFEEIGASAPYDVIVCGTSVGNTGWVEMLRLDHGIKICSTTGLFLEDVNNAFIKTISNYNKINSNNKSILLYVDLTERSGREFKIENNIKGKIKALQNEKSKKNEGIKTPIKTLIEYSNYKKQLAKNSGVEIININGEEELFYIPDLEGLSMNIQYDSDKYLKLSAQFSDFKDIAAEKGCIFAIAAFPTKSQQYEYILIGNKKLNTVSKRENLNILKKMAIRNNIPFLDLEEKLTPIAKDVYSKTGNLLWYKGDTHMNELGSRYTAVIIKEFIEEINKSYR